jgi:hypothetical protein
MLGKILRMEGSNDVGLGISKITTQLKRVHLNAQDIIAGSALIADARGRKLIPLNFNSLGFDLLDNFFAAWTYPLIHI